MKEITEDLPQGVLVQNILSSILLLENIKNKIFSTINLPVVWYGCETWSVTLREEHGLSGNRVLRKIFGTEREQVIGDWRKLHNLEVYDQRSSPAIIWVIKSIRIRWARHMTGTGESRGEYMVLVEKLEGT